MTDVEGDKPIQKPALLDGNSPKHKWVRYNESQLLERVHKLIADGQVSSKTKDKAKKAEDADILVAGNNEFLRSHLLQTVFVDLPWNGFPSGACTHNY